MNRLISALSLVGILALCASVTIGQTGYDDFVSIAGKFAIRLPGSYADYKIIVARSIAGKEFNGAAYRWQVGSEQVAVSYASGLANLESSVNSDNFIKAIRDDYLKNLASTTVIGEKKTALDGHPGLIFVMQSDSGRSMGWIYLVRNRYYFLTLSLNEQTKVEENVNLVSTFRLVPRQELEPRYEKLASQLTPVAVGMEATGSRVTSDVLRLKLKGKPMKIVTESEPYIEGSTIGVRDLESQEEFNEGGDLVKAILFSGGVPETVRIYGYLSGDRIYREQRRATNLVLVIPEDKKRNSESQPDFENTRFKTAKLKYKYDGKGQLTEMHVVDDSGDEIEKFIYDSTRVEHTFSLPSFTDYAVMNRRMEKTKIKDVDTLDSTGNVLGTLRATPEQPESHAVVIDGKAQMVSEPRFRTDSFKYQYQYDDHGNWISRITIFVQKGKSGEVELPVQVTYRTITYFS